jgi:phosphonate transport system ATP-binding protein
MIEFLGVGVPRGHDGWLLHRVCTRLNAGQTVALVSGSVEERGAMLDAAIGRIVPIEGRVWLSRRPLMPGTLSEIRSRIVEVDLTAPLSGRRSLVWNTLAAGPRGFVTTLSRLPRASERRAALDALAHVGLDTRARDRGALLTPEERTRLAVARALSRRPEWIAVREVDSTLDPAAARELLSLLSRVARATSIGVLVSVRSTSLAPQVAERIIAITDGLLTFDGPSTRFAAESPRAFALETDLQDRSESSRARSR